MNVSNFKIELPYTSKLPDNTIFYVDDVCFPHTWHTVETGVHDKLYSRAVSNSASIDHVVTLRAQKYNGIQVADEIATLISSLI